MNKKATIMQDAIIWFWRIILVVMVSIFIYVITFNYLNIDISTEELELKILTTKLLYSDSCIKYKNPGEIDLTKFNDPYLQKCYLKNNLGYRIILTDLNNKEVKVAKSLTRQQESQIELQLEPSKYISSNEFVLYKEQNSNELKPGILKVEVIKNV